ncbi:FMN-dependent NADH:quinone oxidoreductase, partial [Dirofilaria immitis]
MKYGKSLKYANDRISTPENDCASLTASPSFISKFVEKIRSGECYEFATTKFHNGLL